MSLRVKPEEPGMEWDPPKILAVNQTILVTDIRNSTACFRHAFETRPPKEFAVFFHEFAHLTLATLHEVGIPSACFQVNNFLMDGFLIFIAEPAREARQKRGPIWAIDAALRMIQNFTVFCKSRSFTWDGFEKMKLACGIGYGCVFYGRFTGGPRSTGISAEVTLAFRLSKKAPPGKILISDAAHRSLPASAFKTSKQLLPIKGFGKTVFHEVSR